MPSVSTGSARTEKGGRIQSASTSSARAEDGHDAQERAHISAPPSVLRIVEHAPRPREAVLYSNRCVTDSVIPLR